MIRLSISVGLAAALAGAAVLTSPADASACGGSFSPPPPDPQNPQTIEIVAQRMVLSISQTQTVLWSQIEYEGPPEEFAWVLPVGPGSTLELASPRWFEALEAATSTHVVPPGVCGPAYVEEPSSGGGCSPGCGAMSANDRGYQGGDGEEDDGSVTVVSRGSLGPYDTVTLASSKGEAVKDWLTVNGYNVPADVGPILDEYTAKGMDFVALRLKPESSTGAMQPVRVVTKGASPTIPFRMMVAGAQDTVPIALYVIGDGRYAPQSYPEVTLDPANVVWDFFGEDSSYPSARLEALKASEGGRGFLTTFAQGGGLHKTVVDHQGNPVELRTGNPYEQNPTAASVAELYFKLVDEGAPKCVNKMQTLVANELATVEDCASGACSAGAIPKTDLECEGATDLAAALVGMRPGDAWVTRLEANIPKAGLTTDLTLKAAAAQEAKSGWIIAGEHENCNEVFTKTASLDIPRPNRKGTAWAVAAFAFGAALLRRRGKAADLRDEQ
jgi:hypothetical protein